MDVATLLGGAREALGTNEVIGTPVERDGVTVIPVAHVRGGGGGGGGEGPEGEGSGMGGGFGFNGRPVGAFVLRDGGQVEWLPAIDWQRLLVGCQLLGLVALLTVRRAVKRRR